MTPAAGHLASKLLPTVIPDLFGLCWASPSAGSRYHLMPAVAALNIFSWPAPADLDREGHLIGRPSILTGLVEIGQHEAAIQRGLRRIKASHAARRALHWQQMAAVVRLAKLGERLRVSHRLDAASSSRMRLSRPTN